MVETGDDALLYNSQLMEGYSSEYGMKGLKVVPFLTRKTTQADIVNMYVRDKTPTEAIISSRSGKARRVADGARLTQVRATAKDSKGRQLEQFGFEYFVTKQRLKQPGYSLQEDVKDLSAIICTMIENSAVTTLKGDAAAAKATELNKNWNDPTTTLDHIQSDLVDIDVAYDNDELLYDLNILFHSKKGHGALRKKININQQQWTIPLEGYDAQKALEFEQLQHLYGGNQLSDGEMLGWDKNRPAAAIYYGTLDGQVPEVYDGLPEFAPIISAYTEEIPGIYPEWKIQLGASWTVLTREPKGILYDTGFVS